MFRLIVVAFLCGAPFASIASSQITFQAAVPVTLPSLTGARASAAGDVDGDHDADLAVAFATSNAVAILANDGSGTFALVTSVTVGAGPRAVVLADLDGDGDLDAATANETASTVTIAWNLGASWVAGPSIACGSGPRFLHAADLDVNGATDLVTSDTAGNTISVMLNQGGGVFAPAVASAAGASPREIESGEFTGDGIRDLVVASANTNQILLFAGLGSGAFAAAAPTTSSGTLPVGLATGDVDGDGDLDVVSSNFLAPSLTVFVNGGSGAFTTASFPLGTHVQDIVLADFDVDGDADIGGLDVSVNQVRIAENIGAGSFFVGQGFAVGASTSTLITADLDGNFIQDLVTADFGAGLSLLVNALPGPVMGPAGAGNTPDGAGGLFDALMIDGSAGGPARRVNAVAGSTIVFSVSPPPLGPASAPFLVWGTLGAPTAASQTTLPIGLGELSFPPLHLDPSNPALFVLANGFFPDPAALVSPPPAPWSIPLMLPPFAATASLQGLAQEAGGLRVTNGLILVVQ